MQEKETHISHSITTGTFVRALLVVVLFYNLYYVRDVLLVIITAIVLASAVEPGARWFMLRKLPRVPAVLIIYVTAAAVCVSSFYFFIIPLVNDAAVLIHSLPQYSQTLAEATTTSAFGGSPFLGGLSSTLSIPAIIDSVNTTVTNISTGFFGTLDVAFGGILSLFLIIVLSFYLAVQEDGVGKFLRMVTPLPQEKYIMDLWTRSKEKIGLWMQGQILLAFLVAVLVFLGLTLVGVREALVLAFLAGLFEIIPLFGAFLAAAPAILVAFTDSGITLAFIVACLFLIIQQFESQLIYPLVVKKVVGVPPIISILAIVIGAKLAGLLGVIVSVPLAAVMMEFLNDFEKRKVREISD
jgi:predicted PurR-regulated permease PerM